jgi:hypothetical protein
LSHFVGHARAEGSAYTLKPYMLVARTAASAAWQDMAVPAAAGGKTRCGSVENKAVESGEDTAVAVGGARLEQQGEDTAAAAGEDTAVAADPTSRSQSQPAAVERTNSRL